MVDYGTIEQQRIVIRDKQGQSRLPIKNMTLHFLLFTLLDIRRIADYKIKTLLQVIVVLSKIKNIIPFEYDMRLHIIIVLTGKG